MQSYCTSVLTGEIWQYLAMRVQYRCSTWLSQPVPLQELMAGQGQVRGRVQGHSRVPGAPVPPHLLPPLPSSLAPIRPPSLTSLVPHRQPAQLLVVQVLQGQGGNVQRGVRRAALEVLDTQASTTDNLIVTPGVFNKAN